MGNSFIEVNKSLNIYKNTFLKKQKQSKKIDLLVESCRKTIIKLEKKLLVKIKEKVQNYDNGHQAKKNENCN